VRRAPQVVCYWHNGRFLVHNYATGRRSPANAVVVDLLDFCGRWRSSRAISRRFRGYAQSGVTGLVRDLITCSYLQRSDREVGPRDQALADWSQWNPAAGFFHWSTKDVQYPDGLDSAARAFARNGPRTRMPSAAKQYRGRARVSLTKTARRDAFSQTLVDRRTWRRFGSSPVDVNDLGAVLELTWGVQHRAVVPGRGEIFLKTSPSGGARHPGEVYVLALRVKGLERGLYHYGCDRHDLTRLARGATTNQVDAYLPGQTWYKGAAALLLMTAVFPREQWRYRFPRAYRAVLIEAGHLCQTFCLVSTWLGLAPFCSMAFADSRIERDLGIDGVAESVLYVGGIGMRPEVQEQPWMPAKAGNVACL